MSFGWTIADPALRRNAPMRAETFNGYFTDIQRVARRSLPRRPTKDLCTLLGLADSPLDMDPSSADGKKWSLPITAPKVLVPVSLTADRPSDTPVPATSKVGAQKRSLYI